MIVFVTTMKICIIKILLTILLFSKIIILIKRLWDSVTLTKYLLSIYWREVLLITSIWFYSFWLLNELLFLFWKKSIQSTSWLLLRIFFWYLIKLFLKGRGGLFKELMRSKTRLLWSFLIFFMLIHFIFKLFR